MNKFVMFVMAMVFGVFVLSACDKKSETPAAAEQTAVAANEADAAVEPETVNEQESAVETAEETEEAETEAGPALAL